MKKLKFKGVKDEIPHWKFMLIHFGNGFIIFTIVATSKYWVKTQNGEYSKKQMKRFTRIG